MVSLGMVLPTARHGLDDPARWTGRLELGLGPMYGTKESSLDATSRHVEQWEAEERRYASKQASNGGPLLSILNGRPWWPLMLQWEWWHVVARPPPSPGSRDAPRKQWDRRRRTTTTTAMPWWWWRLPPGG
jgi:hypothetical protein